MFNTFYEGFSQYSGSEFTSFDAIVVELIGRHKAFCDSIYSFERVKNATFFIAYILISRLF